MELLKQRIIKDGREEGNILKVDSFLNHQIDIACSTRWGANFTGCSA